MWEHAQACALLAAAGSHHRVLERVAVLPPPPPPCDCSRRLQLTFAPRTQHEQGAGSSDLCACRYLPPV